MVLKEFRPHVTQASRTAEGSRPYQPQLGHTFRNLVLIKSAKLSGHYRRPKRPFFMTFEC